MPRRRPPGVTVLDRLRIEATPRGIARISLGAAAAPRPPGRHVDRARRELGEYLAGRRTYFTVPLDLGGLPPFQSHVLAAAARIPFGAVVSYGALARAIGHPRAARAAGHALAANPVPILVPCHRVIRSDGTWGPYAFGPPLKTRLLALERATPPLVGCTTTGIVCRRGCPHERRVAPGRRVAFASMDEAENAGYRPCRVCRPARRSDDA